MAKKMIDEAALKQQMMSGKPVLTSPVSSPASVSLPASEVMPKIAPEVAPNSVATQEMAVEQVERSDDGNDEVLSKMSEPAPVRKPKQEEGMDKELSRYEKLFLTRSIVGLPRTNVGISMQTLEKVERVVNRLFDGRIAVSTFIDNLVVEHLMRNEKTFNKWLLEKSTNLFD